MLSSNSSWIASSVADTGRDGRPRVRCGSSTESPRGESGDRAPDAERRRRTWRRRVQDVHHAFRLDDAEVVAQETVALDCLGADAGAAAHDVVEAEIGDELSERGDERALRQRAI